MQTVKALNNPQAMANQLLSQNPQVSQLITQYGDPKTAFYKVAEQQGLNPKDLSDIF